MGASLRIRLPGGFGFLFSARGATELATIAPREEISKAVVLRRLPVERDLRKDLEGTGEIDRAGWLRQPTSRLDGHGKGLHLAGDGAKTQGGVP